MTERRFIILRCGTGQNISLQPPDVEEHKIVLKIAPVRTRIDRIFLLRQNVSLIFRTRSSRRNLWCVLFFHASFCVLWLARTNNNYAFFFNGSTAPLGPGLFFNFMITFTDGRTPRTSDHLIARPLPKHRKTQTQNKHIHTPNIHALCGIQTHDPSLEAREDSSCLRPLGYSDRHYAI
jgi:hypothetical protein